MQPNLHHRDETGRTLPFLVWSFDTDRLVITSAAVGGGIGPRTWLLNATVDRDYARIDLDGHVDELRRQAGLSGAGVGLLTAVDVTKHVTAELDGVTVTSTVGVTDRIRVDGTIDLPPTSGGSTVDGADTPVGTRPPRTEPAPGTINIVVHLPVALSGGALVNAVATATEAKVAALTDAGLTETGTPTDSVTVTCPTSGPRARFTGSGAPWGARLGRLVYETVLAGIERQRTSLGEEFPGGR